MYGFNLNNVREMNMDQIRRQAPSVFAETPHSETSSKYLYIPTSKIVDGLIKADFIPMTAKQVGSGQHGKHVIHFSHKSVLERDFTKKEFPLIRVQNSHDAKSSFQIDTGFYRLVCANGLVMPASTVNSARIRHNLSMQQEVIDAAYRVLGSFAGQIETVEAMKSVELSQEERMLLADSASRIIFSEEQLKQNQGRVNVPQRLLLTRRQADQSNDLWTVFNRIQENSIKGGIKVITETGKYSKMREVKSIDREKQINVELMTLAQKMAELKGALKVA